MYSFGRRIIHDPLVASAGWFALFGFVISNENSGNILYSIKTGGFTRLPDVVCYKSGWSSGLSIKDVLHPVAMLSREEQGYVAESRWQSLASASSAEGWSQNKPEAPSMRLQNCIPTPCRRRYTVQCEQLNFVLLAPRSSRSQIGSIVVINFHRGVILDLLVVLCWMAF